MATKKKKATKKDEGKTIQRGGKLYKIDKSKTHFAVKRSPKTSKGELPSAQRDPDMFAGLTYIETESHNRVEVFSIDEGCMDDAMKALRQDDPDTVWCAHTYHFPGDEENVLIPTDSIFVRFKDNVDDASIGKLLDKFQLEAMPSSRGHGNDFILKLTSNSTANPIKISAALLKNASVLLAEPDFSVKGEFKVYRPTDTLFPQQWHLENNGGIGLTAGADVLAPQAWDISRGDRSIVVAVIDDGVEIAHPDFASSGKIVKPMDAQSFDSDPSPETDDDNHGTACAGVAVADENGSGVVGAAPNCSLMPIRWSQFINDQTIALWFDHPRTKGADVISCSWGVRNPRFFLSTSMKDTISDAAKNGRGGKGCVVIFAAGNESRSVNNSQFHAGFAVHPDVVCVSASNSHDKFSHYSNFGKEVWISAPSSGAGGRRIVTTDRTGGKGYQSGNYTTVNGFGGTSSSTPLVAGICGLMLSVNPDLTAKEVKDILKKTAKKIDRSGGGYDSRGHSHKYGWGRVDAFAAVKEAQSKLPKKISRSHIFERLPGLEIPDNQPVGVSDFVRVNQSARIQTIEVTIDISHTYRGDLEVELVGPEGRTAMLNPQGTGSRGALNKRFTLDDTTSLAKFVGTSANGVYTIRVADHAAIDTGTLDKWSLVLGLDAAQSNEWSVEPGLLIPDNDSTGVDSTIAVDGSGVLKDIEVTADINHTYIGDLKLTLTDPQGASVEIQQPSGDSTDDLKKTYRVADNAGLQTLVTNQAQINGDWSLNVSDNASIDEGKLNSWKLKLIT
jgi:subtilisin-like proprotein convertase family protein/subtilisin family serine protease